MLFLHKPGTDTYKPSGYTSDTSDAEEPTSVDKSSGDTGTGAESVSSIYLVNDSQFVVATGVLTLVPIDPSTFVDITAATDSFLNPSTDSRIHLDIATLSFDSALTELYVVLPGGALDILGDPDNEPQLVCTAGETPGSFSFNPNITWYRTVVDDESLVTFYTSTDGTSWTSIHTDTATSGEIPITPEVYFSSTDFSQESVISEIIITNTLDDSVLFQDTFSGSGLDIVKWNATYGA